MIKTCLLKDAFREITYNKRRFFLTTLIVFISSMLFIGFNNSVLDVELTEKSYKTQNNYMDILVTSSYGFDYEEQEKIKNIKYVSGAMLSNNSVVDAKINKKTYKVKINNIPQDRRESNNDYINRFSLSSGRYPSTINEGVVEEQLIEDNNLSLGSLITLKPEDTYMFRAKKIKIVGTFKADNYKYDKKSKYTVYLANSNFTSYNYENIYVTINDKSKINEVKEEISKIIEKTEKEKYKDEIDITKSEIETLKQSIEDLKQNGGSEEEIQDYNNSLKSEEIKLAKLEKPENKITVTNDITKTFSYDDKMSEVTATSVLLSIICSLVFPTLLAWFVIKLFISKKREIRTLMLLNYNAFEIISKYVIYIFTASFIGTLFGGIISNTLIPVLILKYYNSMNIMAAFQFKYVALHFIITVVFASLIAVVAIYKIMYNKKFAVVKILKRIKKV